MTSDKNEIANELTHSKEILRAHRQRLRANQIKEANFGFNVPPEVLSEIQNITDQIKRDEEEIKRLKTELAIDKISLADAEFKALLAEAWDTPHGHPSVAGEARLEFNRLRLGILRDLASEIELKVRKALAEETLNNLDLSHLDLSDDDVKVLEQGRFNYFNSNLRNALQLIGRAAFLNSSAAVSSIRQYHESAALLVSFPYWELLVDANNAWNRDYVQDVLKDFHTRLRMAVEEDAENIEYDDEPYGDDFTSPEPQ